MMVSVVQSGSVSIRSAAQQQRHQADLLPWRFSTIFCQQSCRSVCLAAVACKRLMSEALGCKVNVQDMR